MRQKPAPRRQLPTMPPSTGPKPPPVQWREPAEQPAMLRSGQEREREPVPVPASEPVREAQAPKRRLRQARLLTEPPNRAEDAVGWPCQCPMRMVPARAPHAGRHVAPRWEWWAQHLRPRWRVAAQNAARAPRVERRHLHSRWHSQARLRHWRDDGRGPHRPPALQEKRRRMATSRCCRRCVVVRCRLRCSTSRRCGRTSTTRPNRRPAMPPRAACRPAARTGASTSSRSPLAP